MPPPPVAIRPSSPRGAPSIALREWLVALFGSLSIAFTAWGLAGYKTWTLHLMLAGGLLTCIFALVPLPLWYNGEDGEHSNRNNYRRLLRLPAFWLSVLFLLYLALQALNPAARVSFEGTRRLLFSMDPPLGKGFPTSVMAAYTPMNAWRVAVSFLAGFSLFWGLWVGLRRRKTVILVLWAFILSGFGMGMAAILMHFTEAKEVLWTVPSGNSQFWGSFFYRNQGAAYLNLILVAAAFMFFYHAQKSHDRGHIGGPHLLLFCIFALVASSVAMALSRGGILFGLVISIAFACLLIVYTLRIVLHLRSIWLSVLPAVLLALGAVTSFQYVDLDAISRRFGDIEATIENADKDTRMLATRATWDMAQDQLVFGWGAGSFRYLFHRYQREYPSLHYKRHHPTKGWIGRRTFRYAHNDILQYLAEYGLVGCSFLLFLLASYLWVVLRGAGTNVMGVLMLLVGLLSTLSHAFLDFILNSPAYLIAWIGFCALAAKLVRLEWLRARSRAQD